MSLFTPYFFLHLILSNAYAAGAHGPGDFPIDPPRKTVVVCERLLNNESAAKQTKFLVEEFLGRPFVMWQIHDMTAEGMRRMGLDPHSSQRALQDLVLIVERSADKKTMIVKLNRYANGGFKTIQRFEFSDPFLTSYRSIQLPDEHLNHNFEQLQREYPDPGERQGRIWAGYQTRPDPDGVRRHITFSKTRTVDNIAAEISFGLDVPPSFRAAKKYSEDLVEVTDDLRTPSGNWRRIAVLTFARLDN